MRLGDRDLVGEVLGKNIEPLLSLFGGSPKDEIYVRDGQNHQNKN